jgi:microcystin-dependent protein
VGQNGGTDRVTLGARNLPPHAGHMLTTTSVKTSLLPSGVGSQATCGTSDNYVLSMDGATSTCSGAACSESVGSGDPFDVTSPYLVVNYIIAVQGYWPTRP